MGDAFEIRRLSAVDINLIAEIDRAEQVGVAYAIVDGRLAGKDVSFAKPTWDRVGTGEHSVASVIAHWEPVVAGGATYLGAFENDRVLGLCIVDASFEPGMAWLAFLNVNRPYRSRGVGSRLWAAAEEVASEAGASSMYVSATSSDSAVGFYQSRGCVLAGTSLNPTLYEMEPDDIHFVCPIG